ncbi:MAG TPA: spermidine synthase, partial [Vicinamibacteria bacterium]|nr:spermidine synthase [Vicinamibacteria bacterium]
ALEVVWLRFLQLFVIGTGLNFALILATVLLGITLGALAAGRALGRWPHADNALSVAALAAAFALVFAYIAMDRIEPLATTGRPQGVALLVAWVALPTCMASGALFTLAGAALQREMGDDVRASASLTLANTMGGMVGAALGGFVLLPQLGMERSFFLLALSYVAVSLLGLRPPYSRRLRIGLAGAGALAGLVLALFPFGLMENHYLKRLRRAHDPQATLAAMREGRTETIQYLRRDFLGEPLSFRMLTNRYSMSATSDVAQRYMRLFVYWALAVRPEPERALLISYGVGTTADALTEVSSLRSIDVVDISADVLALAPVPFPPPEVDPLRDPRVRVHVEDGRFFLQASGQTFDLITAEPPPLKVAGVVSLYTQEYFEHMRGRLAPGGVVTYWLPVYQVHPDEARTVVRGFCNAFPDCTLWNAAALEWMLAGTRDALRPVDEEAFTRPWRDPAVGPRLREIAVESPESLGTAFLADAEQLRAWAGPGEPLIDDYPQRLASHNRELPLAEYVRFMDAADARRRFAASRYVATVWPPGLRARTDAHFEWQGVVNAQLLSAYGSAPPPGLGDLQRVLGRPGFTTLATWIMDSSPREQAILDRVLARGAADPPAGPQAVRNLLKRDYAAAGPLLETAARSEPQKRWSQLRALNALLGGDKAQALRLANELRSRPGAPPDPQFVQWLEANLATPSVVSGR